MFIVKIYELANHDNLYLYRTAILVIIQNNSHRGPVFNISNITDNYLKRDHTLENQ